jgi:hypothetical protein
MALALRLVYDGFFFTGWSKAEIHWQHFFRRHKYTVLLLTGCEQGWRTKCLVPALPARNWSLVTTGGSLLFL